MTIKLYKVTICADCGNCSKPFEYFKATCKVVKDKDGVWGNPIDTYPYIPIWCPLDDAE